MDSVNEVINPSAYTDNPSVVETWNLGKTYLTGFWLNQKVVSLQDCSLSVYQGETFGLLGPNGAGKTTLLKVLLGITKATSGKAVLLGRPVGDRSIKQRVGYLPENAYYYDYLTGWEFLTFVAGLFQIPPRETKKRVSELLDLVGLAESAAKKKQLRQYSKGMVQRIGMAQALINDPDVVFLDEPMSGLDPMGRYQVRQIILSLKEKGKTIFFNSHILSDVELICDRIAILAQGKLICNGSLNELLGSPDCYQVVIKGGTEAELSPWVKNMRLEDEYWHGQLTQEPEAFIHHLATINAQLLNLRLARLSLEDFFLKLLQEKGIYKSS